MLAAAVLGGLAAAVAATASGPASAADLNVTLNLGSNNLSGLPSLPSLPPLPGLPTATPTPPSTSPGLNSRGSVPPLCPPTTTCPSTPNNGTTGTTTGTTKTPGNTGSASRSAPTSSSSFVTASGVGVGGGAATSSAGTTLGSPEAAGLSMTGPPPVAELTPLAGISFGRAPYLWPLFLLLDLIAAGAVVVLVRRTWSATSGAD